MLVFQMLLVNYFCWFHKCITESANMLYEIKPFSIKKTKQKHKCSPKLCIFLWLYARDLITDISKVDTLRIVRKQISDCGH
uniref:Uncharacterized protein n=1 Tax=Anguilla anguilla TaxID=7936 RepID=A0A0E9XLI3_ANGAN